MKHYDLSLPAGALAFEDWLLTAGNADIRTAIKAIEAARASTGTLTKHAQRAYYAAVREIRQREAAGIVVACQ